jgi:DNA-binding transcriptional LysR family regulator
MNLENMKCFISLAECLNFTKVQFTRDYTG